MFVRNRMTPNPVTTTPNTTIYDALELMRKNNVRRLPVVEKGQLIGIVTESELLRVSPSPATSLSVFELNYILSKMQVKDVMTRDVVTVTPDTTIEEAAVLMRDNVVSGLPVLEDGKLVGIITETNIFDAFVDLMGLRKAGVRLTLEMEDRTGMMATLTQIIKEHGVNIISIATFLSEGQNPCIVMRLDTTNPQPVVEDIKAAGYKIYDVTVMNNKEH